MSKVQKKQTNIREKLTELLDFRKMRDRLSGLGLYVGKDRTNTDENLLVRGGANVDDLQLAEISASVGGTAVDVFVYDTSRDSDGGKWRERTQHTSWYNEELNTATRGARREFPAVAVIVAEASKVTIYDGDDPDLSMWMVINQIEWNSAILFRDISCINATMVIGSGSGITVVNFINERLSKIHPSTIYTGDYEWGKLLYNPPTLVDYGLILHNGINDVSMTVLPNAPIDENTGLPVPTIAVATDGGVSVIKDDGTVVNITCGNSSFTHSYNVVFDQSNRLFLSLDGSGNSRRVWGLNNIPVENLVITSDVNQKQGGDIFIADNNGFGTTTKDMFLFNESNPQAMGFTSDNSIGTNKNLFRAHINKQDSSESLYNFTTSKYNTGWMPGDIKLAALSDSVVENVGVNSDEIIQNGESWTGVTGSTAPTEWIEETDGSATFSLSSGELTITQTGTAPAKIYQAFDVIKGRVYNIEARIKRGSSGIARFQITNNSTGAGSYFLLSDITSTTYQTITKQIRAEETGQYSVATTCYTSEGGGGSAVFDYVRVRATTELITNGDFSTALGSEWVLSENSAPTLVGGALQFNYDGTDQSHAEQQINTVVGQRYVLSLDLSDNAEIINVYIGNGQGESQVLNDEVNTIGSHSFDFIAQSTTSWIRLRENTTSSSSPKIDNISVRIAEPDRSVNNNGLQIFGEIQKTPVASGADLVAYSGFSANNYLVQPYNADLDFGTGDFLSTWWIYRNDTLVGSVFHRSSALVTDNTTTSDAILQAEFGTSQFQAQVYTNGFGLPSGNSTLTYTGVPSGVWTHMAMSRKSNVLSLYVNGKFIDSVQSDATVTNTNAPMSIGTRVISGLERPLNGSLALLRFSATAPTDAQIAKIYRDEKPLFQEGAQATLYGTSDATTALSYDEKTELLHVGTSAGRSDFSGLRRINNTTTAITTSISAHNNLIAEQ